MNQSRAGHCSRPRRGTMTPDARPRRSPVAGGAHRSARSVPPAAVRARLRALDARRSGRALADPTLRHRTSPRVDRRGDVAVAHRRRDGDRRERSTGDCHRALPRLPRRVLRRLLVGRPHPRSAAATFLRSPLPLVPLCVAYLALLCASWSPDTLSLMMPGSLAEGLATGQPQFFPRLDGIMTLLSRRVTAASAWLHIACINFFVGKVAATRAAEANTGGVHVAHSITGPIGLRATGSRRGVRGSKARERRRARRRARLRPRCASSSASTAGALPGNGRGEGPGTARVRYGGPTGRGDNKGETRRGPGS